MIDLVFAPWVKAIAVPALDPQALAAFVADHRLDDLARDPDTPIGRLAARIAPPSATSPADPAGAPSPTPADLLAEFAGRFCYRAWGKGRATDEYIANVIAERHGSVLAHATVSFIITGVSRALTHELIRHHVGTNPSQESQRYVTAESGEIEVVGYRATRAVVPPLLVHRLADPGLSAADRAALEEAFRTDVTQAIATYNRWQSEMKTWGVGATPTLAKKRANEAARAFLPNAIETRLVWTMNLRAARNVIEQRGSPHADLEIRRLAVALARELKALAPLTFADTRIFTDQDGFESVENTHIKV